jgi:hypothetical protein
MLSERMAAFTAAELAADRDALRDLLTDDFGSIGEQGYRLDKPQWIARHDDFHYTSISTTGTDVRRYEGAAIVRGDQHSRAVWQGRELDLHTRFSQVWVEQQGRWRLAAIQFSSLPG